MDTTRRNPNLGTQAESEPIGKSSRCVLEDARGIDALEEFFANRIIVRRADDGFGVATSILEPVPCGEWPDQFKLFCWCVRNNYSSFRFPIRNCVRPTSLRKYTTKLCLPQEGANALTSAMLTALGCVTAHYPVLGRTGPRQASQSRHVRFDLPNAHDASQPPATHLEAMARAVRLPTGRPPTRIVPGPSSAIVPDPLLRRLPDRLMEFSIRGSNNNSTLAEPPTTITPAVVSPAGYSRHPHIAISTQFQEDLATSREAPQLQNQSTSHNKRSYQALVAQGPNIARLPNSSHKLLAQGKRQKLMDPEPWMQFHPFMETLERWSNGAPVDCSPPVIFKSNQDSSHRGTTH